MTVSPAMWVTGNMASNMSLRRRKDKKKGVGVGRRRTWSLSTYLLLSQIAPQFLELFTLSNTQCTWVCSTEEDDGIDRAVVIIMSTLSSKDMNLVTLDDLNTHTHKLAQLISPSSSSTSNEKHPQSSVKTIIMNKHRPFAKCNYQTQSHFPYICTFCQYRLKPDFVFLHNTIRACISECVF